MGDDCDMLLFDYVGVLYCVYCFGFVVNVVLGMS